MPRKANKQRGPYTPSAPAEILLEVMDLADTGRGRDYIAEKISRKSNTVRYWTEAYREGVLKRGDGGIVWKGKFMPFAPETDSVKLAAAEMENSALKAQLAKRPAVIPDFNEPKDPDQIWAEAEVDNERRCERAIADGHFSVDLGPGPVAVSFISDQHIALRVPTDLRKMREDAELIASTTGLYAILGGDGVDNHIKHRSAIINSRSSPKEEYELYNHYLKLLSDSMLVMISGNHDNWTKQTAGIDMVQWLADEHKLCYSADRAYITVKVGEVEYLLAIRHQYRYGSSFNQTHTVKRWWEMGEINFDIGVVCHQHESSIEPFYKHGIQRWAARPGSYQLTSAYCRQFGFNVTRPTCPTFILSGEQRDITGFEDVHKAAKYLKTVSNE